MNQLPPPGRGRGPGLGGWAWGLVVAALSLILPSARALAADTVYVALMVGSNSYQGQDGLGNLQYADDDVLRFLQTVRPLVHPDHVRLALTPDEDVARGLASLGLAAWSDPDTDAFKEGVAWLERTTRAIRDSHGPDVEVRVLLYVSAHGDAFGMHLSDGILSGAALQSYMGQLSADSVLLIADACYSSSWLVLKGDGEGEGVPQFPLNEVADAVRDLERVGMVAAQSGTREERGLVRGGLLTHVVASALMGAADLDQDGQIHYPELAAYLNAYGRDSELLHQVRVQAPRKSPERPPVLVDLDHLGGSGLYLPPSGAPGDERFWVTDPQGRMVAELCKPGDEARRLRLPAGTYRVQRFDPPDAWYGREGEVQVAAGFTTLRTENLSGWWVWTGGKGAGDDPVPPTARPLTQEEAGYRVMSPVQRSVSWRALPGRLQPSLRLGMGGLSIQQLGDAHLYEKDPLSYELPRQGLTAVADLRLVPLRRGFLALGAELGGGRSPHTAVYESADVTVLSLHYRLRVGYERPIGLAAARLTAVAGGGRAWATGDPSVAAYRQAFIPALRLEAAASWRPADGRLRVTAGAGPEWGAETFLLDGGPRPVAFRSLFAFVGVGW